MPFDPYRTWPEMDQSTFVLVVVAITLLTCGVLVAFAVAVS